MTRKATRARGKAARPARRKKRAPRKRTKGQWHEDAVIHQDLFFAEAASES